MANLLQSSQNQATQAPGYFTDYLSNLATRGQEAQQNAKYVGAQPLQEKAFQTAEQNLAAQQPTFEQGKQFLGRAGNQDITGATAPYLQAGTSASPLAAAQPLICSAADLDLGGLAGTYMSPYVQNAVQSMSDIGQRNIRQNLSPMATAASVGSGQFGSQRGAQVLGQVKSQAEQDLNAQIAQMLNTGYGQALCAAKSKQGALSQLAGTTVTAQQAQNDAQLKAAAVAGCSAAKEALAAQQAGTGLGNLAQQASGVNLACINALSTLGGQQQTIKQNEQMFPLTSLSQLASLMSGYNVPTTTRTTLCMSPLSVAGAAGSSLLGLLTPDAKTGQSQWDLIKSIFGSSGGKGSAGGVSGGNIGGIGGGGSGAPSEEYPNYSEAPIEYPNYSEAPGDEFITCNALKPGDNRYGNGNFESDEEPWWARGCAAGGSVQGKALGGPVGGLSMMGMGGMPSGFCNAMCATCEPYDVRGTMTSGIQPSGIGCASTQFRGALPYKG